jgi:glycolate oxidase iron-sulfur subunit
MDSPRGRIYLMRGVVDGRVPLDADVRKHLDLCLDCRACESACPSGVKYGQLIEPFRVDLQKQKLVAPTPGTKLPWWQRFVVFNVFPHAKRARLAVWPAKLMQALRIDRLLERSGFLRLLPRRMREMHALLPPLPLGRKRLGTHLPAIGPKRANVALFTGCVADALFHEVNWMTARVLQLNGCDVWIPPNQVCCGALHFHSGMEAPALNFAQRNLDVFLSRAQSVSGVSGPENVALDAIVINVAGCGSMLKDYGHLFAGTDQAGAAKAFTSKVKDINEFLIELGPVKPTKPLKLRATYHDACHLCHAQQIRKQPRQLLELIPGLELVPLNETEICCGAAGSYNLTQPDMADRLGERKAANLLATKPEAVFTANAGCLLQIRKHLKGKDPKIWVAHPIEALWRSYEGERL